MPELPEVETVKRVLSSLVIDKKISEIDVRCEKMIKTSDSETFIKQLVGQKFTSIRRYGKYLFFDFEHNTLVSHLRMEGKYNYFDITVEPTKHDHIIFYFDDNSMLIYNDTRKFGTMELVDYRHEDDLKSITKLGLEPGAENLTVEYFKQKANRRNTTIKQFLLDQTVITGLGNIYVDEVLFTSYVHPLSKISNLSDQEIQTIINNANDIIAKSIKAGGTTVKSFTVSGNASGTFQHQLRIYGHSGAECDRCQTIIEKIKVGGRGTSFCPKCQVEK